MADFHFERALQTLAANIIRVCRGAGRPHSIAAECIEVVERLREYRHHIGKYPSTEEIADALSSKEYREWRTNLEESDGREHAFEMMMRGGLQLAASRILRQTPQERSGEGEMLDGVRAYQSYIEKERKRWDMRIQPGKTKGPVAARKEPALELRAKSSAATLETKIEAYDRQTKERQALFANSREIEAIKQLIRFGSGKSVLLAAIANCGPHTSSALAQRGYVTVAGSPPRLTLTSAGTEALRRYQELEAT